jgi:hypothetical protein
VTRFLLQHLEEKDVHQPCGGGKLRLRGAGRLQAPSAAACLAPWLGWLWCRLQCFLPPPSGAWLSVHHTGDGHAVRRSATSVASPAPPATPPRGLYKTSYAVEVAATFLDGLVLTPVGGQGRGPLCHGARAVLATVASKPSAHRWSLPLVRLPDAEVVASASETTSATCRRASNSLALMASLSPPVGGWGRGHLHNGAHIEVAITAVTPSWRIPQGQWPRTSSATLLASGSLYLPSRDGTRIPLEGGCNTFAFCKVLLRTIYQAMLALIYVSPVPAVCDVVDSSLVPGPLPGMQA